MSKSYGNSRNKNSSQIVVTIDSEDSQDYEFKPSEQPLKLSDLDDYHITTYMNIPKTRISEYFIHFGIFALSGVDSIYICPVSELPPSKLN